MALHSTDATDIVFHSLVGMAFEVLLVALISYELLGVDVHLTDPLLIQLGQANGPHNLQCTHYAGQPHCPLFLHCSC